MPMGMWRLEQGLVDDVVMLPEVVVEDSGEEPYGVLRPAFDMVWNAFGLARSLNYDEDGSRVRRWGRG